MGKRSRKRRPGDMPLTPPHEAKGIVPEIVLTDPDGKPLSKSEKRNAQARAQLEPLKPGERPGAVTVAAVVATVFALAQVVLLLAGVTIKGKTPSPGGVLFFAVIMLVAAWGLWNVKYWAVLGFEALLAIVIVAFSLFLLKGTLLGILICTTIVALSGWLFWKLVRAMARIQMPRP